MTDSERHPLYLFARLPLDVRHHVVASNDLDAARAGHSIVADGRLHVTLAILNAIDAPREHVIWLVRWILSTIPPFAFHVAFDELVVSARSAFLKASAPLEGVRACQRHVAGMLADYGAPLPAWAMPTAHVTMGYGYREGLGRRGIDGISWLVDELVLVRSRPGRHEVLGEWRLPRRPEAPPHATPATYQRASA